MASAKGTFVGHKANSGSRFSPIHPPMRFVGIDGCGQADFHKAGRSTLRMRNARATGPKIELFCFRFGGAKKQLHHVLAAGGCTASHIEWWAGKAGEHVRLLWAQRCEKTAHSSSTPDRQKGVKGVKRAKRVRPLKGVQRGPSGKPLAWHNVSLCSSLSRIRRSMRAPKKIHIKCKSV